MSLNTWRSSGRKVTIADRAKKLPEHHYKTGYKFYSGIEHSDAVALFGY